MYTFTKNIRNYLMKFLRNPLFMLCSVISYSVLASDIASENKITITQYEPSGYKYLVYEVSTNSGYCFVNRNNEKLETHYSFGVQQSMTNLGTLLEILTVVWNSRKINTFEGHILSSCTFDKTANTSDNPIKHGMEFALTSENLIPSYKTILTKMGQNGCKRHISNIDRNSPEIKILEGVLTEYARQKMFGLKFNEQYLLEPSIIPHTHFTFQNLTSWLSSHKKTLCLGLIGWSCLGFALYCMSCKTNSSRLIAAPLK